MCTLICVWVGEGGGSRPRTAACGSRPSRARGLMAFSNLFLVYVYVYMYICLHVFMFICIYVSVSVCVCVWKIIHTDRQTDICMCLCKCIHTYRQTDILSHMLKYAYIIHTYKGGAASSAILISHVRSLLIPQTYRPKYIYMHTCGSKSAERHTLTSLKTTHLTQTKP